VPALGAASIQVSARPEPASVGTEIARVVYGGLKGLGGR